MLILMLLDIASNLSGYEDLIGLCTSEKLHRSDALLLS
jgi:hypothetical protein